MNNVVFCFIKFIGKGKSVFYMRMWCGSLEYLNSSFKWGELFIEVSLFF